VYLHSVVKLQVADMGRRTGTGKWLCSYLLRNMTNVSDIIIVFSPLFSLMVDQVKFAMFLDIKGMCYQPGQHEGKLNAYTQGHARGLSAHPDSARVLK